MEENTGASLPIPQGMPHLAARFANTPLMIHPPKFDVIVRSFGARAGFDLEALPRLAEGIPQQMAARYSAGGSDRDFEIADGIAIIPVAGTLLKKSSWMSSLSGCCSYLDIQSQMQAALDDSGVRGILLDIDSPGGETNGCFELSDFIYRARGQKPIYAAANDYALSAAYAIASAADKIFVTRTGAVGSVGVYALHVEQTGWDKQVGAKYTYVFAGKKKVDGNPHEPLSEGAEADIQAEVDREYEIFTETVARNRKADAKEVIATQAGLLWAENAIPLLADEVGTCDEAFAALSAAANRVSTAAKAAISTKGEAPMPKNEAKAAVEDEMKKAADTEPDPDDKKEPEEDEETEAKKSKSEAPTPAVAAKAEPVRTMEDIKAISALCKLGGCPEMAAEYLKANKTVAEVSEILTAAKAEETEKTMFSSRVDTTKGASARIQDLETEAAAYVRQNRGASTPNLYSKGGSTPLTKERAMAQLLEANPEAYGAFNAQHNAKVLVGTLEAAGYQISVRK